MATSLSTPLMLLLSTFRLPRTIYDLPSLTYQQWELYLGKDPQEATQFLIKHGYIKSANLYERLDFEFNTQEIKSLLHSKGLSTNGRKDDLVRRLVETDPEFSVQQCKIELFVCSPKGLTELAGQTHLLNKSREEHSSDIPNAKIQELIAFTLGAAVSGVIGNRADAFLMSLIDRLSLFNNSTQNSLLTQNPPISSPAFTDLQNLSKEDAPVELFSPWIFTTALPGSDEYPLLPVGSIVMFLQEGKGIVGSYVTDTEAQPPQFVVKHITEDLSDEVVQIIRTKFPDLDQIKYTRTRFFTCPKHIVDKIVQ